LILDTINFKSTIKFRVNNDFCAFANSSGGHIVLGIGENKKNNNFSKAQKYYLLLLFLFLFFFANPNL
jgi:predicted HTH transcriptional regulator